MKLSAYAKHASLVWTALFLCAFCYYFYTHNVDQTITFLLDSIKDSKHFIIHTDGSIEPAQPKIPKKKSWSQPTATTATNDLLEQLKTKKGYLTLFTPDDNTYDILLELIAQEKQKLSIAIFTFTDGIIVQAIQDACNRGVKVEVITDKNCLVDRYGKIDDLYHAGAKVYVYNPNFYNKKKPGLMHHKFIVFSKNYTNKGLVWTGSYNFTKAAHNNNQENVIILNRKGVVRRYAKQFERIKGYSDLYKPFLTSHSQSAVMNK
jgi:phosphatidylserine/phosphatidylglycerophosphate/cardiolipin synthase-like enzyme